MTSTKVCPAQRFLTPSTFFNHNISSVTVRSEHRGSTVIKVLCYKSEGRWFDPTWCHWIFYWHRIFTIALWPWGWHSLWQKWVPGVFPGGKGGRCVRLTNLPPSCAVVMKSGNLRFLEPSGPAQACNGVALPLPFNLVTVISRWYCRPFLTKYGKNIRICDDEKFLCSYIVVLGKTLSAIVSLTDPEVL